MSSPWHFCTPTVAEEERGGEEKGVDGERLDGSKQLVCDVWNLNMLSTKGLLAVLSASN